jgi:hypothetical protein
VQHAPTAHSPFDWLREPDHRIGALRQIESALARGWLDPTSDDVAPLRAILAELVEDPATTPGQRRRMARLLAMLDEAGARVAAGTLAP